MNTSVLGGGIEIPPKSNFKEFAHLGHGHITLEEMSKVVDTSNYFTFCVFRNPYSRAVSLWSFWNRHVL